MLGFKSEQIAWGQQLSDAFSTAAIAACDCSNAFRQSENLRPW